MARGAPGEAVYEPQVQPEDLPRKVIPHMSGASFGSGITDIADILEKKYQADSATWAGNQLAQLNTQAVQSLQQAKDAQPANEDPAGFTDKFLKGFDEQAKPFANSQAIAGNPYAQRMLSQGITDLRQKLQDHTLAWQSQQQVAYRENSFYDQVKSQSAVVEAFPELKGSVGSTLTDVANAIGGDPSKRLEHMRVMDSTLSLAAANGLTRGDPRGTLQALNDPQKAPAAMRDALLGLNDAQREAVRAKANEHLGDAVYSAMESGSYRQAQVALLKNADVMEPKTFDRLQQAINSQQEHQLVMADKVKRDASDSLLKNAILMQQQGKLTDQWIEKNHNVWEPTAYEYAKKLLAGVETKTDAPTYLNLVSRQSRGEDVRDDTMSAASNGLLDKSDAAKLIEASGKETPSYVKQGHDYIQTAGQVSQLEPDPAKAQTLANMQQDWQNMVRDHPDYAKDPSAAEAGYRSIVRRYQLVAEDKTRFTLDYPPYFPGTRMQPDIPGMKQATFDAFTNKTIPEAEFNRRAALIQQWQNVLQVEAQRKAAAAKAAASQ